MFNMNGESGGDDGKSSLKNGKRRSMGRCCCCLEISTLWLDRFNVLFKLVALLLLLVILGFSVQNRYSAIQVELHRDIPRTLLLATAQHGDGVDGTTFGTVCYTQLSFGGTGRNSKARGSLCANPSTGYVSYEIEVYDITYGPPLSHIAVHGPTPDASSTSKSAPAFLTLDPAGGVGSERILWGLLKQLPALLTQMNASPADYYLEIRPRNGTLENGVTGAPIRSLLN